LQISSGYLNGIIELLYDLERLTFDFFDRMSISALQIYYSALPFSPLNSEVWAHFHQDLQESVTVVNGIEASWSANLRTTDGHSGLVLVVAFSQ
jgi:hypothetical protein